MKTSETQNVHAPKTVIEIFRADLYQRGVYFAQKEGSFVQIDTKMPQLGKICCSRK